MFPGTCTSPCRKALALDPLEAWQTAPNVQQNVTVQFTAVAANVDKVVCEKEKNALAKRLWFDTALLHYPAYFVISGTWFLIIYVKKCHRKPLVT